MSIRFATMTSLLALAACSGGSSGGGSVVAKDGRAPVITLTPSSASVEGGETVAITATATDDVDGSVPVTLTCNGGALTGNLLVTTAVAADGSIVCTGTASDKAGNAGTATTSITIKTTVSRVTSETGSTLSQGQYGAFLVSNLALNSASYAGKLGTRDITLDRGTASSLNYVIPMDMAPGTYQLDFTVEGKRYTYPVTVAAAPTIADPKAVVTAKLTTAIANLDALVAGAGASMSGAQKGLFAGYRTKLTTALAQLDTMAAADLNALAVTLQVNTPGIGTAGQRTLADPYDPVRCNSDKAAVEAKRKIAIVWASAGLLLIGQPTLITQVAGLGIFLVAFNEYENAVAALRSGMDSCAVESYNMHAPAPLNGRVKFVTATAVTPMTGFQNKKSQSFRLVETRRLEGAALTTMESAFKALGDVAAKSPYVPDSWKALAAEFAPERMIDVPASEVTLASVSNPNILGAKGGSGTTISLVFSYVGDPPAENIPFTFTLQRRNTLIPQSGELVITLPGAEDGAVELIQGKPVSSQLQVRGAESIEIVTPAAHGTATIGIDGALRYTPTGQYFGTDQLKYRARNQNGVSRTATVLFTINRQFEGSWSLRILSKTDTESSKGLCPNEENNTTVQVSKVSDTLYTASYGGFPLNFTMASKDDPNGLQAKLSGTYDDDPGETTESVTVNIPNSSELRGYTTWFYEGPNGTRCAGQTDIFGTK